MDGSDPEYLVDLEDLAAYFSDQAEDATREKVERVLDQPDHPVTQFLSTPTRASRLVRPTVESWFKRVFRNLRRTIAVTVLLSLAFNVSPLAPQRGGLMWLRDGFVLWLLLNAVILLSLLVTHLITYFRFRLLHWLIEPFAFLGAMLSMQAALYLIVVFVLGFVLSLGVGNPIGLSGMALLLSVVFSSVISIHDNRADETGDDPPRQSLVWRAFVGFGTNCILLMPLYYFILDICRLIPVAAAPISYLLPGAIWALGHTVTECRQGDLRGTPQEGLAGGLIAGLTIAMTWVIDAIAVLIQRWVVGLPLSVDSWPMALFNMAMAVSIGAAAGFFFAANIGIRTFAQGSVWRSAQLILWQALVPSFVGMAVLRGIVLIVLALVGAQLRDAWQDLVNWATEIGSVVLVMSLLNYLARRERLNVSATGELSAFISRKLDIYRNPIRRLTQMAA